MSKKIVADWSRELSLEGVMPFLLIAALMSLPAPSLAGDVNLSDEFSMELDASAREKVGDADYHALVNFFHEAERAIESKNLEELMALYSEKYSNRSQDKKFAEGVWRKIFLNFDDLSAKHSIELLTYDERTGRPVAVLECSGLLQGTPKGSSQAVTVDSWDKQWHVLIKEDRWRLFGNSGKSKERYGAVDQLTHPLF